MLIPKTSFFILVMLILSACANQNNLDSNQLNQETTIPVDIMTVQSVPVEQVLEITGTVFANSQNPVMSISPGEVMSVHVKNGDVVSKGDPLVQIDMTDANLNIDQARSGLLAAESSLQSAKAMRESSIKQATIQLEQAQKAYNQLQEAEEASSEIPSVISEELQEILDELEGNPFSNQINGFDLEDAERNVEMAEIVVQDAQRMEQIKAAEAQVEQAEIALQMAERQADQYIITAPITGQIENLMIKEGQITSPQAPLLQIVNLDPLLIKGNVSANQLASLATGQQVDINVRATNDKLQGKITHISSIPNEGARTYPFEVEIQGETGHVRPGMISKITVTETRDTEHILIPTDVLLTQDGKQYVFVVIDDRVSKREVLTSEQYDQSIAIDSGLSNNDQIVVNGQFRLSDDDKIDVRDVLEAS